MYTRATASKGLHAAMALIVSLAMAAAPSPLAAQADTLPKRPFFTWRDVAIIEAFAIATVAVAPLDRRIAERLQDSTLQANRRMRDLADFVETVADPGAVAIGIGMYAYGKLRDNQRAADLGLHGLEALIIGAQFGNLMKGVVGRARPYIDVTNPHDYQTFRGFRKGTDYKAFPSGHSIGAFAAASAVVSETKKWWPKSVWYIAPVMYGGAASVAWSRMFHNKHWASDVITGAAIGTFTGLKVVHWHHTHPRNRIDRRFLGTDVATNLEGDPMLVFKFRVGN